MRRRPVSVSAGDAALLAAVGRTGSVVVAARAVRMSRDRAVYRLRRLRDGFGRSLLTARRGGAAHGESRLTPFGASVAAGGFTTMELLSGRPAFSDRRAGTVLVGRYRRGPPPTVALARGGPSLRVAFAARDGASVRLTADPESILLARSRFPTSARNVLEGVVERGSRDEGGGRCRVAVRVGAQRIWVGVTTETVREMRLRRGGRVFLYLKATALRPWSGPARGP